MGDSPTMVRKRLGKTDLAVTPVGFGAFKIGRNTQTKYLAGYALPDEQEVARLLNGVLDLGVNYIDTAPAYGLSEQRIGATIDHRRDEYVLSTKVGETYEDGQSSFDFSSPAIRHSITRSLERLRTDTLDLVFIHSDGNDLHILNHTDAVETLQQLRDQGLVRAIGMSGKTPEGAAAALAWADAIMVEYHMDDRSHEPVIRQAAQAGVGVIVKKGLASGQLAPNQAIRFVLENANVTSMVIGGLNLEHFADNIRVAQPTQQPER